MRLRRLIGVAVVGMLALSCSDSTAPPERVTALYVLESIGGQPLPATFSPNSLETTTVFWGILNLDAAGNATMTDHRRREFTSSQREITNTRIRNYKLSGDVLIIGPPCGPDTLNDCYPQRYGQINGPTLILSSEVSEPHNLKYRYRLASSN